MFDETVTHIVQLFYHCLQQAHIWSLLGKKRYTPRKKWNVFKQSQNKYGSQNWNRIC